MQLPLPCFVVCLPQAHCSRKRKSCGSVFIAICAGCRTGMGINMNILKKFVVGFVALIVLMAGISCSLADTILPLADSVFDATKVELSSSGRVKLYCVTYENMATIKVTACWLEKEVGGEWEFDCSLTPPAEESHNTNGYAASFNCLSSIGSGPYRLAATFNADGYEITRRSIGVSF